MTQDVADRMLKHLKQAHDLMRRLFEGSIGDVQMEAIKLAVDAGKDPSVASASPSRRSRMRAGGSRDRRAPLDH